MPIDWNDAEITARVRTAAMRGVMRGTEMVRTEMIRLILSGPKSGRMYGKHQASAPGQPPASDTGRLVNSLETVYDQGNLTGRIKITAKYGLMLEFGTVKMEPRPFARPALANMRNRVFQVLQEEISRG